MIAERRRRRLRCWCASAMFLAAVGCSSSAGSLRLEELSEATSNQAGARQWSFIIPAGAGAALDAGHPLDVLPARLDVKVGETIEIRNEDSRGHLLGPFYVRAGETYRQRFASRGQFVGVCTVHPSGRIIVVVS